MGEWDPAGPGLGFRRAGTTNEPFHFLAEILQAKRDWGARLKVLKEITPTKEMLASRLSFRNEGKSIDFPQANKN